MSDGARAQENSGRVVHAFACYGGMSKRLDCSIRPRDEVAKCRSEHASGCALNQSLRLGKLHFLKKQLPRSPLEYYASKLLEPVRTATCE
jgi:hypothetical protein